jgi:hypothetical protein
MLDRSLAEPPALGKVRADLARGIAQRAPTITDATIVHASWRSVGEAIDAHADRQSELRAYADDVLEQMVKVTLLGYKGAPVLDDLQEMTVANAFAAVNRATVAIRELILGVQADARFRAARLEGWGRSIELLRDGTSKAVGQDAVGQDASYFELSTVLCPLRKPDWPDEAGVFLAL